MWVWDTADYLLRAAYAPPSAVQVKLLFEPESRTPDDSLLFVELPGTGEAILVSRISNPSVPGPRAEVLVQPGGSRVALFDGDPQAATVRVVDLSTCTGVAGLQVRESTGKEPAITARSLRSTTTGFVASWQTASNGRGDLLVGRSSIFFGWDGAMLFGPTSETETVEWSPTDTVAISETTRRLLPGRDSDWPSIQIGFGKLAQPEFRLRSSAISYGDRLPPNHWLSDGSGFVVAVRGDRPGNYSYAVVPSTGAPIQPLPSPPSLNQGSWFEDSWIAGPVPAPFDADLFSFGRLHLYNRRTRRWFSANIAADGGPDHLDPWSAGHEMVFALPHAGHDGVLGLHMLAPRYAQPPFDDTLAFRVEVDPGGLTLRTQPDAASTAVTILYDGELLYLAESPDPSLGPGESSVHEAGDALWLYIRAESGHEGWGEQYVGGVDLGRRSFVDKTPGTFAVAS